MMIGLTKTYSKWRKGEIPCVSLVNQIFSENLAEITYNYYFESTIKDGDFNHVAVVIE